MLKTKEEFDHAIQEIDSLLGNRSENEERLNDLEGQVKEYEAYYFPTCSGVINSEEEFEEVRLKLVYAMKNNCSIEELSGIEDLLVAYETSKLEASNLEFEIYEELTYGQS